jgi:hypothetical protein
MNYPVIIFCYKRLDCLKLTVEHLRANNLASVTDLYIYSDGPKTAADEDAVLSVRKFLRKVEGFRSVKLMESSVNRGLAASIIGGVSEVLNSHEAAIVLEDDLLTSTNFLDFMNQALEFYRADKRVFSVAGYSSPIRFSGEYTYDNYFTMRGSSWGWATWRDRWSEVDWQVSDYADFVRDNSATRAFNRMGSDMTHMLARQMEGKINSWAIRWTYHQFRKGQFTVFPAQSKVKNVGFGGSASNTEAVHNSRFATELDNSGKTRFAFDPDPRLDRSVISQFVKPYTLFTRIKYKVLGALAG